MKMQLLAAFTLLASPAFAAEPEHKMTTQQSRMAHCAHESKGLKTEERHHFMSECLKGHAPEGPGNAKEVTAKSEASHQQEKMKACNAEAAKKDLQGDERHAFISGCLKG
jgi:hypothetical protein